MNDFTKQIYFQELKTQCEYALAAFQVMMYALESVRRAPRPYSMPTEFSHTEVFRSAHSFLTHASNISKILWATDLKRKKGVSKEACNIRNTLMKTNTEAIRSALGIEAGIEILENRDLRNHLEHFNERLLDWEMTGERKNFVQDFIGPPDVFAGLDIKDSMRSLDPTTLTFTFRGDSYELRSMFDGVLKIYKVLARFGEF